MLLCFPLWHSWFLKDFKSNVTKNFLHYESVCSLCFLFLSKYCPAHTWTIGSKERWNVLLFLCAHLFYYFYFTGEQSILILFLSYPPQHFSPELFGVYNGIKMFICVSIGQVCKGHIPLLHVLLDTLIASLNLWVYFTWGENIKIISLSE